MNRNLVLKPFQFLLLVALALTPIALASAQVSTPVPLTAPVIAEWTIANPGALYAAFGSMWVPGHHDFTTTRIDPTTNEVIVVIPGTGFRAEQALQVGDVLWVTGQSHDTTWIDPQTNAVTTTMAPVPGSNHYMAFGFGALWTTTSDYKVDRINPDTGQILREIPYASGFADCNSSVHTSAVAVWVDFCDRQELVRIDPETDSVVSLVPYETLVEQARAQTSPTTGNNTEFLWVAVGFDTTFGLLQIDPTDGSGLTFIPLTQDQLFGNYTVTDDYIWLGGRNGMVYRLNLITDAVDTVFDSGPGDIYSTEVGFGSVWVAKYDQNLVQRLDIAP